MSEPKTYLSSSGGKHRVIHQSMPISRDHDTPEAAMAAAKTAGLTPDPHNKWDGDKGAFVPHGKAEVKAPGAKKAALSKLGGAKASKQDEASGIHGHIEKHIAELQANADKEHADRKAKNPAYPDSLREKFDVQHGPKYSRITRTPEGSSSGSVHHFIDRTNGNILKAASYKGPAKNFARGNVVPGQGSQPMTSSLGRTLPQPTAAQRSTAGMSELSTATLGGYEKAANAAKVLSTKAEAHTITATNAPQHMQLDRDAHWEAGRAHRNAAEAHEAIHNDAKQLNGLGDTYHQNAAREHRYSETEHNLATDAINKRTVKSVGGMPPFVPVSLPRDGSSLLGGPKKPNPVQEAKLAALTNEAGRASGKLSMTREFNGPGMRAMHKEAGEKHLAAARQHEAMGKGGTLDSQQGHERGAQRHLDAAAGHAKAAGGDWDEEKHPRDESGKFS